MSCFWPLNGIMSLSLYNVVSLRPARDGRFNGGFVRLRTEGVTKPSFTKRSYNHIKIESTTSLVLTILGSTRARFHGSSMAPGWLWSCMDQNRTSPFCRNINLVSEHVICKIVTIHTLLKFLQSSIFRIINCMQSLIYYNGLLWWMGSFNAENDHVFMNM